VILTGAGISAESGLGTFRDADGLWEKYPIEQVATPEGFARNPALVHEFYNMRRRDARAARPNAAHDALARLQRDWDGEVVIVTQNVDGLHEAAGASVMHMHGRLDSACCMACAARWPAPDTMSPADACPQCGATETRPDIVWFGEIPQQMDEIAQHLGEAGIFASIGTSGQVYPAAGFVREARLAGARTVELNLERSEISAAFDSHHMGLATQVVPAWVAGLLAP